MTPYIGCEYARERLEAFIDEELSVEEQVAVESHVRWCRTCAARIEDFQLVGASVRLWSPGLRGVVACEPALSAVVSRVLMRVRAEREQSLAVRLREQFSDWRLLWPALGASMAVAICVTVAAGVLQRASVEIPESLAMRLEAMVTPGSDLNPLRPDNNARIDGYFAKYVDSDRAGGISMPRVMDEGVFFDGIGDQEAMFTMSTVVNREGRVANLALLNSERTGDTTGDAVHATDVEAVLDAVRQSRFAPAQTSLGRAVAVNLVWVVVVTTVQTSDRQPPVEVTHAAEPRRIPPASPPLPIGRQSARTGHSPTA